jgi:hypothetical protein
MGLSNLEARSWTELRQSVLEEKAEKERAKAGKTFRRTGKHTRKTRRAEKALARMQEEE